MPIAIRRHSSCQHLSQMEPGSPRIGLPGSGPGRWVFGWGLIYDYSGAAFGITRCQYLVGFPLSGAFRHSKIISITN